MVTVYAFDDVVRAQVGDVTVEASRGAIREGRAALVASGNAEFSTLSVDALDLYRFDFQTSRYRSFTEHVQSWTGEMPELAEGTAGASATPVADLLSADWSAIAAVMTAQGDPQARQALFAKWTSALALPLRQQPDRFCISRWTGSAGTQALLVESLEPLVFTREVSVTLTQHLPPATWQPIGSVQLQTALAHVHFSGNQVTVPFSYAIFAPGDLIVRVIHNASGTAFAIYTAPQRRMLVSIPGTLQGTISPPKGFRPDLDQLRNFPNAAIVLMRNKTVIAAIAPGGSTGRVDKPINVLVFDNGAETAALLLPTVDTGVLAPLAPGRYTLTLGIDRKRWRDNVSTDPEARYAQQQAIDLNW